MAKLFLIILLLLLLYYDNITSDTGITFPFSGIITVKNCLERCPVSIDFWIT